MNMWSGGVCVYAKVRLSERYRQKESEKKAKRKKRKREVVERQVE